MVLSKYRRKAKHLIWAKYLLFGAIVMIMSACSDLRDVEDIEFRGDQTEYAIPILTSEVSLVDVFDRQDLEETELLILPDSSLLLRYSGDVLSQTARDLFPDVPGGLPIGIRNENDTIPLPFQRLILNKASLTGDTLAFGIVSNLEEDVRVVIRVPSLLRDGQPIEFEQWLRYEGSLPVQELIITNMDGMSLELYNNSLIVQYEAYDANGERVSIEGVTLLYNNMSYDYLEGFFTKNDVDIPGDEINIEVYDSWINGQLYFAEPKVTVQVDNSFGFPVRANINYLRVIGRNGQKVDLESPINDQIDFLYPELDEIGDIKTNIIRYDETNSNIEEILNIQPTILEYDIDAVANPDQDSSIIGFVTDSSLIRINVTVELPVMGWADNFSARDTIEINLDSLQNVEEAEFKLIVDNGMPVTLFTQLFFLDENNVVLDSLFSGEDLQVSTAVTKANGKAVSPVRTIRFELMDKDRLDKINGAQKAVLEVRFLTFNAPNQIVSIGAQDKLSVKLGAKVKLEE